MQTRFCLLILFSAGDQYIVVAPSKIGKPVFYYKKQFVNLRSLTTQADYIAITHPKFLQSANNYVNSVSSMYGVSKDLISVEDIFDEFSFGYPQPEAIRLFTVQSLIKTGRNPNPHIYL